MKTSDIKNKLNTIKETANKKLEEVVGMMMEDFDEPLPEDTSSEPKFHAVPKNRIFNMNLVDINAIMWITQVINSTDLNKVKLKIDRCQVSYVPDKDLKYDLKQKPNNTVSFMKIKQERVESTLRKMSSRAIFYTLNNGGNAIKVVIEASSVYTYDGCEMDETACLLNSYMIQGVIQTSNLNLITNIHNLKAITDFKNSDVIFYSAQNGVTKNVGDYYAMFGNKSTFITLNIGDDEPNDVYQTPVKGELIDDGSISFEEYENTEESKVISISEAIRIKEEEKKKSHH